MKNEFNLKSVISILMMFVITISIGFSFSGQFSENENIKIEQWDIEKTNISELGGIVFFDDYLYVTDKEKGIIVVFDKDGNHIRQSSANKLFLIEPTVIKTYGEAIYVIDSGNNQLKILSENFDFLKCVNLPNLGLGENYWDLEIIDEKIYLSSDSLIKGNAAIYQLDENGVFSKIGEGFIGYISNFANKLMAVNSLEYFEGKNEKGQFGEGSKSGRNGMYKVHADELILEFEYANKYVPLDFLLVDDFIYVFSGGRASLEKYTTDGQYIETIIEFDDSDLFVQLTSYDNVILISYPVKKAVYKIILD